VDDGFELFDSGEVSIQVSSRHQFGTVAGGDSLTFNVNLVDFERGGEVTSTDGSLLLQIPPGAIPETMFFTTVALKDDFQWRGKEIAFPEGMGRPTGLQFTVGPAQREFEKMATLSFNYRDNQSAQLSESDLAIAMFDGGQWMLLGGELYRDQKSISVLIDRTGVYSLINKGDAGLADDQPIPNEFFLSQNYPNPFNPNTTIRFGLPVASHTTLRVVNLRGQVISTLLDETLRAGEHLVEWDSTDDRKIPVASGVYLYQLKVKDYIQTRKLVVVK
ncbi:T9SS type A sorting domain-containing protein, partial [bacterium]|nr:T9SS type A sorting domain-containing protein [bacterium]